MINDKSYFHIKPLSKRNIVFIKKSSTFTYHMLFWQKEVFQVSTLLYASSF